VIHIDTWWMRWRQYADFRWDRRAFPGRRLVRATPPGLKLSVWQHPYISIESDLYAEGCGKLFAPPTARW
jgi:alpha-glucosidase (family GH31 glycosyl hydrolase)